MLSKLFGFDGRMGRLSYFGWISFAGTLWSLWIVVIIAGLGLGAVKGSLGALAGSALVAVVGVVPLIWMCLALASKRLRDAGFPPILVLPVVVGFSLFDALVLSRQTGGQPLGPLVHNTPMGLAVNLVFGLALLFWPSAEAKSGDDAGGRHRSGEAPWHERALTLASTPPAPAEQATASPASQMPSSGQPRPFGRRLPRPA